MIMRLTKAVIVGINESVNFNKTVHKYKAYADDWQVIYYKNYFRGYCSFEGEFLTQIFS
jgi:hypothetical protein